jgi:hypothetical protein
MSTGISINNNTISCSDLSNCTIETSSSSAVLNLVIPSTLMTLSNGTNNTNMNLYISNVSQTSTNAALNLNCSSLNLINGTTTSISCGTVNCSNINFGNSNSISITNVNNNGGYGNPTNFNAMTLNCSGTVYIPGSQSFPTLYGGNFNIDDPSQSSNLGYQVYANTGVGSFFGTGYIDIPANASYGLLVSYRIACGSELDVVSDIRIKENIATIDTENALNTIRKLQPKTFNYIDVVKNGIKTNYGFIAQEVDEVFSDSITKQSEYIPNIYTYAKITNKNTFSFLQFSTSKLIQNAPIKIYNETIEKIVTIKEIIDERSFSINEEIESDFTFVYGQQVNDFHLVEKNAIFTLTTAAVKQLDTELQETKEVVKRQQTEIDSLKDELQKLKDLFYSKLSK